MILFISDLHLDDSRPAIAEAFFRFLAEEAAKAEALYILGDLFELWVGDDDDSALVLEVQDRLRRLADSGTRVFFMHGNRDFLIGARFGERSGATLLPDPFVLECGGDKVLLMHGDTLCTGDRDYQAFRQQVRAREWMDMILAKPLEERRALGRQLRQQSQSMNSRKSEDIMDVTHSEVIAALQTHGADKLIHGHTHRPARHPLDVDGRAAERIVLGDWDDQGWCLGYESGHWELQSWRL
ncbi:UDP-2,3-diacylglucosamine diphosphatase [Gilvimarinus sp. F26214L]|uniref:UDP-2,3-diacylglucosamine diphosphatase n=1 Tax=Gilvimarinus sp. DZF01 TaxID=3461371 RepID=UPI0040452D41